MLNRKSLSIVGAITLVGLALWWWLGGSSEASRPPEIEQPLAEMKAIGNLPPDQRAAKFRAIREQVSQLSPEAQKAFRRASGEVMRAANGKPTQRLFRSQNAGPEKSDPRSRYPRDGAAAGNAVQFTAAEPRHAANRQPLGRFRPSGRNAGSTRPLDSRGARTPRGVFPSAYRAAAADWIAADHARRARRPLRVRWGGTGGDVLQRKSLTAPSHEEKAWKTGHFSFFCNLIICGAFFTGSPQVFAIKLVARCIYPIGRDRGTE